MTMTTARAVALAAGQLATGPARYYRGITVRETAASTATVKLYDNTAGSVEGSVRVG